MRVPLPAIRTFVISLPDCTERRRLMTERLGAAGIPFTFFDAVDGRTTPPGDDFHGQRIDRSGFWSDTAVACTLSHLSLYRMLLDRGIEQALVFEDDAAIPTDLSGIVESGRRFDCDLLKLEGDWGPPHVRAGAVVGHIDRHRVVARRHVSLGSAAYIIRRSGAMKLVSLPVLDSAIDVLFADYRPGLKVYELSPAPVSQDKQINSVQITDPSGATPCRKLRGTAKLSQSVKKRWNRMRVYGLGLALRMEIADRRGR